MCLSVAWQYAELPADLSASSLVVGLCVVNALQELGVDGASLKWPNDLVTGNGKLGGILIEMRAEAGGPVHVVIGIGLNVRARRRSARQPSSPRAMWPTTSRSHRDPAPDRNAIVAGSPEKTGSRRSRDFPRHGLKPHLGALERLRRAVRPRGERGECRRDHARRRPRHRCPWRAAGGDARRRAAVHFWRSQRAGERHVNILLVDIGNTRVKWALLRGEPVHVPGKPSGARRRGRRVRHAGMRRVPRDVERVLAVSVAGATSRPGAGARRARARRRRVREVRAASAGGVSNGYRDVWRLGADRLGGRHRRACAGARHATCCSPWPALRSPSTW